MKLFRNFCFVFLVGLTAFATPYSLGTGGTEAELKPEHVHQILQFLELAWSRRDPAFSSHQLTEWAQRTDFPFENKSDNLILGADALPWLTSVEQLRNKGEQDHLNTPARYFDLEMGVPEWHKKAPANDPGPGGRQQQQVYAGLVASLGIQEPGLVVGDSEPVRVELLVDPDMSWQRRREAAGRILNRLFGERFIWQAERVVIVIPRHDYLLRALLKSTLPSSHWKPSGIYRPRLREEDRLFGRAFFAYDRSASSTLPDFMFGSDSKEFSDDLKNLEIDLLEGRAEYAPVPDLSRFQRPKGKTNLKKSSPKPYSPSAANFVEAMKAFAATPFCNSL